jgi:hypothetical protein
VWWLVWVGIGVLLVVLLGVSWWSDRNTRRRGAAPRSAQEMSRERWARDRNIQQEVTQVEGMGLTPRSSDAARDTWRGRPG